jgi:hypothetical protein
MSFTLSFPESVKVIDSAIQKGQSLLELIQTQTGITTQHLALLADELLQKLRSTTYELIKVKSLTGNTKTPIERSLSKSLCAFLYELKKAGGEAHYNDIRETVKIKYGLTVNDYSSLSFWRLIQKAKGLGMWVITERGKRFLIGELKLAEKLTIQNNKVIAYNNKSVSIDDFLTIDTNSVSDFLIEKRKDGLSRWHE